MQLKQVFLKYYGQVDEDMGATLKEDADFERAYNAKDVIALQKMLKAINFNYKKSKEPIKTTWQATTDFILAKQHTKGCLEILLGFNSQQRRPRTQKSDHGSPFVDIICHKRGVNSETIITG